MSRKGYLNSARKQKQNSDERPQTEDIPRKATVYTLVYGPTPIPTPIHEDIPSRNSVIAKEESIILPPVSRKSISQISRKPSENSSDRDVRRLPPIAHQYQPEQYVHVQPNYRYNDERFGSRPDHQRYPSSYYHENRGETYDPRWWYMPLNSVHAPRSWRPNYHRSYPYTPPKWYELPYRR